MSTKDERWHVRGRAVGSGEPVEWWVVDGRLRATAAEGAETLSGAWVCSGLVDAHVHLSFEAHTRLGLERGSAELVGAHLGLHRAAGVLAVRDAGSLPGVTPEALDGDGVDVVGCGPMLAPPGGFLEHLHDPAPAAQAPATAAAQVRAGWPWVKVILGYPGPDGNPLAPRRGYGPEVLAEIVSAAHEAGGRVAVHVMGPFVEDAVAAGADSIEHGNLADGELIREMAARDIAWIPTMSTVARYLEPIAAQVAPARAVLDGMRETLPLAADLGVRVLAPTSSRTAASPPRSPRSCATDCRRTRRWRARRSPAARRSACPASRTPASAAIVTFEADPALDPTVLARPAAIVAGGRRVS